jgi:hypothetical protein
MDATAQQSRNRVRKMASWAWCLRTKWRSASRQLESDVAENR